MRIQLNRLAGGALAVAMAVTFAACNDDDSDGDKKGGLGGDGGDNVSSAEDFCKLFEELENLDIQDDEYDKQADALKKFTSDLDDLGEVEGMPDDVAKGMELWIEIYGDVSAEDMENEDFEDELEEKYKDREAEIQAFQGYPGDVCGDPEASDPDDAEPADPTAVPTDVPTDYSTDIPTDLATIDPEELQSQLEEYKDQLSNLPTPTQ